MQILGNIARTFAANFLRCFPEIYFFLFLVFPFAKVGDNGKYNEARCKPTHWGKKVVTRANFWQIHRWFLIRSCVNLCKSSRSSFFKHWPSLGEHLFDHLLWSIFQSSLHINYKLYFFMILSFCGQLFIKGSVLGC